MNRTVSFSLIILLCSSLNTANGYFSNNARPSGMGGAFTAVADDAAGIFWNPAGIFLIPGWFVSMNYGLESDIADGSSDLLDEISALDPSESLVDTAALIPKLEKISDYSWLSKGGPKLEFAVAYDSAAFSISGYDIFFIQPHIDLENISADPAENTYIGNNTSSIELSGFRIKEYGLSYAYFSPNTGACIGATAKYMDVTSFYTAEGIWSRAEWDLANDLDETDDGEESSSGEFGVDMGLMFLAGANRIGLVGKNLRKITLSDESGHDFTIRPHYRLGYAFSPTDRFVFAFDYNLTKNRDPFGNKLNGNEISMGFEGKMGSSKWLSLRGGATIDSGGDAPLVYSSGMSINFARMSLDVSYSIDQYGEGSRVWGGIRFFFSRDTGRESYSTASK